MASSDHAFAYRPALDGVRTLAVYLVVVFHAGWNVSDNGFIGVDLFFVLSGFLVTNVLVTDLLARDAIDLRRFYARRMRRLLPASAVTIAVTAMLFVAVAPATVRIDLVGDARAAALYVANWHFIGEATDYFAAGGQESPYLHFWSLAIEEQFYLVFPVVMMALWRLERRRRGSLVAGLALLAFLGLVVQVLWARHDTVRAYYGTDARLYQLLLGALAAVVLRRIGPSRRSEGRERTGLTGLAEVGIVGLVALSTPLVDMTPSHRGVAAAVASLAVIVGLETRSTGVAHAVSTQPAMVRLGRISYGTYLWHWPIILAVGYVVDLGPIPLTVVAVVGSTALAALSARIVEMPVRRSTRLDAGPRRVVAGGLALSVVVALVAPAVLRSDMLPLTADDGATLAQGSRDTYGRVPTGVDWTVVRGDRQSDLPPFPMCGVGATDDCVVVEGGDRRILVVGDSHARMMLPVLADEARRSGATLLASVGLGCPWVDGLITRDGGGGDRCLGLRTGWSTELIAALRPTHVILVQREFVSLSPDRLASRPADGDVQDAVAELVRSTIVNLRSAGIDVTVVDPVPEAPTNPIDCLASSRWVASCLWEVPGGRTPTEQIFDAGRSGIAGVHRADLDRIACPALPVCAPYLDGAFVRRDGNHVQPSWWVAHADGVRRALGPEFEAET